MGSGNPLFTGKDVFPSPHPTPSAKSGVFFAPVGRKKLSKLSPLNGMGGAGKGKTETDVRFSSREKSFFSASPTFIGRQHDKKTMVFSTERSGKRNFSPSLISGKNPGIGSTETALPQRGGT